MNPDYEILSAYLDGQVTDEERARVERLLAEDDKARQLLEELREVSQTVSKLPRYTLPNDFAKQIEASLEIQPRSEKTDTESEGKVDWRHLRRRFLSGRSLAWVAAVLLVALGVNHFFPDDANHVKQVARDMEATPSVESSAVREGSPSISAVKKPLAEVEESAVAVDAIRSKVTSEPVSAEESVAFEEKQKAVRTNESLGREGRRFARGQVAEAPASAAAPSPMMDAAPGGLGAPASPAMPDSGVAKSESPESGGMGMPGMGFMGGGMPGSGMSGGDMGMSGGMPSMGMPGAGMAAGGMMGGPASNRATDDVPPAFEGARKLAASTPPAMTAKAEKAEVLSQDRITSEKSQAFGQVAKPQEIVVICEVKKPAEVARDFDRLLALNHVVPEGQIVSGRRTMKDHEQDSAESLLLGKPTTEESLVVKVDWDQAVGLLQAVQQDTKQFVSVQAEASPELALPEPISQFNRAIADRLAGVEKGAPTRGRSFGVDATEEYNRRVKEAEHRARAAFAPKRVEADASKKLDEKTSDKKPASKTLPTEYRIRFIFRAVEVR